jgi:hypothetical protein
VRHSYENNYLKSPQDLRERFQHNEFYRTLKKSLQNGLSDVVGADVLLTLEQQVEEGTLELEQALAEIQTEKYSFENRWSYLLHGQAGNPDLSLLNAIRLCEWFPKTREGAELRLSILNRIQRIWTVVLTPENEATLLAIKGETYKLLADFDPVTFVPKSIDCFKRALIVINEKSNPHQWVRIYKGLAML